MSNPAFLVATTFDSHVIGTKTHGFRLYDNEAQCYDNLRDSPITDDMELLQYALKCDGNDIRGILDFIKENERGININDNYYDWDEIKAYFP